MNKKLFVMCTSVACAAVLTTVVFATQTMNISTTTTNLSESSEISAILKNSNVYRSVYQASESRQDTLTEDTEVKKINTETEDLTSKISDETALKVYSITLNDSSSPVFAEENDLWIIPINTDEGVSYAYMKKGEDTDVVAERINKLDISEEYRERLIKKAKANEGKWYVAYIKTQHSADKAQEFANSNNIQNVITANNITNVLDMRYVYINNKNELAVYIKTNTSEYIIPYNSEISDNFSVCSISDYVESM